MKPNLLIVGNPTPRMMTQLTDRFVIHRLFEIDDPQAFLKANGDSIEGVATNGHDGVKPELMAALPNLKVVSCFGVGYDGIDATAAAERGIVVTHTPNVLNDDVANTAIMLMLAVSRRLVHDDSWVRSGKWKSQGSAPLTRSIENKPVGILGMGRIGQKIAEKLRAFNCDLAYHSRNEKADIPYRYYSDLTAMARDVDYLVVITPGGAATRHLVDRQVIDALGPEGTLINIARGSVVDEAELVKALEDGRLGGAGLDVFENEPDVPAALIAMDNVVLTPHVGSATVETRQAMGDLTVENLVRYFDEGKVTSAVPECAQLPAAR
jgi:lactate dehydrogenase-like 2-hydroxyacid dehydrogenase